MSTDTLIMDYAGRRGPLFRLALKTGLLSVATLGMYRFWMKTRLRRYYWSAVRPGGAPMEYVGEPLEKLLGFLTAVVFMAFYIGIVNLILMFFSFTLFQSNFAAYALSFVGVLPIVFFAQYRARRYILARTRWRGIRFGLEPGAWGYAWRAALLWLVTLASLGILWPLKTFRLEKYRTEHSYFGENRLVQGGRWTQLMRAMLPVYLAVVANGAVVTAALLSDDPVVLFALALTLPWLGWALAAWKARSLRLLTGAKRLEGLDEVRLQAEPRPWRIFAIYAWGYTLAVLAIGVVAAALLLLIGVLAASGLDLDLEHLLNGDVSGVPSWLGIGTFAAAYFTTFLMWSVFTQVFVTLPLARHLSETLTLHGAYRLGQVRQRARDPFAEAEGFADALDVGAAL